MDRDTYVNYLIDMREQGYKLFALYHNKEMVAVAGAGISINLYYGRHVWVYDLVTDSFHRSKGYGDQLLHHVEEWGRGNGCQKAALSSGLQREDAHRFMKRKGIIGKLVMFS